MLEFIDWGDGNIIIESLDYKTVRVEEATGEWKWDQFEAIKEKMDAKLVARGQDPSRRQYFDHEKFAFKECHRLMTAELKEIKQGKCVERYNFSTE